MSLWFIIDPYVFMIMDYVVIVPEDLVTADFIVTAKVCSVIFVIITIYTGGY